MFNRHHGSGDGATTNAAEGYTSLRRWTKRGAALTVGALLTLSLATVMSASADVGDLTAGDHESQTKTGGVLGAYTDGLTSTYAELDPINFRFDLEADSDDDGPSSGQMQIRFTNGQAECEFFDGTFNLGTHDGSALAVETISGATPTVAKVGEPILDVDDDEWVQILSVSFPADGEARVNYWLTLTGEAGECNGASQHSRLDNVAGPASGDFANLGANNQAVPANQVIELPEILVTKNIDRDGNGSFEDIASEAEFCFSLDGGLCVPTNNSGQVLFSNVTPDGPHTITETQLDFADGVYEFVSGSGEDCTFDGATATATVAAGTTSDDASCVFNNGPADASLTVTKIVTNDNGGTAVVADFPLFIDGNQVTSGVANTVSPGLHTVSETNLTGYSATIGSDCNADGTITLLPGESAECTITNDDDTASLTVTKIVVNDNGGTAVVADFPLFIDGNSISSGVAEVLDAGSYTVSETNLVGYSATISGDCNADGTITLLPGESAQCTITNDDDTASLTVTKIVVNDDGGTAVVADFPLFIDGNSISSGVAEVLDAGSYTVSETNLVGYSAAIGGDCNADGTITLLPGESAECTIINDDIAPTLGRIVVRKVADQYDTDKEFPFSSDFDGDAGNGTDFTLEAGEEVGFDLEVGIYSVEELVPSGWDLKSAVCSDQSPVTAIDLAAEEIITCVFTNEKKDDYNQYPGDDDFDFDTPFEDGDDPVDPGQDPVEPEVIGDVAGDTEGPLVQPAPVVQPEVVTDPAPLALDELPRTGQGLDRATMLGALLLLSGGLAVALGRRFRKAPNA